MSKEILKFFVAVALVLAAIAGVLKVLYVDIVVIDDDRMAPTLLGGEQVLMWRGAKADLGDIMVCEHPNVPGEFVIGRVMGMAGSPVTVVRGSVALNGHLPDRDWRGVISYEDPAFERAYDVRYGIETVDGEEHAFMSKPDFVFATRDVRLVGDQLYLLNDLRSQTTNDSRSYGAVSGATCIGQIFMRLRPAEDRQNEPPFDHGYLDVID